jgi:hypothetical protein
MGVGGSCESDSDSDARYDLEGVVNWSARDIEMVLPGSMSVNSQGPTLEAQTHHPPAKLDPFHSFSHVSASFSLQKPTSQQLDLFLDRRLRLHKDPHGRIAS